MAHIVAEPCFDCKYTDCVVVCPVDCFYEGAQMLYIHPEECIDCEACVPECPVDAIFYEENVPEAWRDFMPVCMMGTARQCAPDGGRPMMVVFNLIFRSGTRPRTPLHAQKVWVVQGKSVWETTNIEQPGDALDDVRMTVRGGPNWTHHDRSSMSS